MDRLGCPGATPQEPAVSCSYRPEPDRVAERAREKHQGVVLRRRVQAPFPQGEEPRFYGKPRVRRFRRDMLDLFLTDPDAAMRSFRAERNAHGS